MVAANASRIVQHAKRYLLLEGEKMHLAEANLYLIRHSVKVSCIPLQLHGHGRPWSTWRVTPTGTNSVQTAPSMFIKLWLGFTQVGKVRRQQIENGADCVKHKTPSVSQVRREQNLHVLRDTILLLEVSFLFLFIFLFSCYIFKVQRKAARM